MASVNVTLEGRVIHAVYAGTMTLDLVRQAQRQIEERVSGAPGRMILYDCLQMDPPSMDLAMEMKAFDGRIRARVFRSATVVKDAMTAFMSKVAFALAREHKVFYNDLDAAYQWLSKEAGAVDARAAGA